MIPNWNDTLCNLDTNDKPQLQCSISKADQALAQLLQYNCHSRFKESATTHRHSKDKLHFQYTLACISSSKPEKNQFVDKLFSHGISISYNRLLEITAQLVEAVVTKFVNEGIICPPILRKGLFTTSALDNTDHNPSATSKTTSFHGTSISIFQHPDICCSGITEESLQLTDSKAKVVPELPDYFTNIQPAHIAQKNSPPRAQHATVQAIESMSMDLTKEYQWLRKVCSTEEVDSAVDVSWAAHHASQNRSPPFSRSITSLLPLLRDQTHSVATVRHVMNPIKETVAFVNPGK